MIDPTVRPAEVGDVVMLDELQAEARTHLIDQRGGRRWLEEHPAHDWATALDRFTVLVSHIDDVVVGYLVLDLTDPELGRVEQVYVTPAARELGFGDEMLATALAEARSAGVLVFEAEALPGDRDTKNLYERSKITARSITVSTRLDT